VKLYVEAKSKADLIRRLAAGEEISGYNYSMFGGGGHYMLDDNLEDGTIIAIYTKKVQGNPVAKAWGTWTNKVLKAESFEAMSLDENDTIICDQCNKNVEGDSIYAYFTLECDCGNILYEDNSYGPFDITDYYGAETFEAEFLSCYECGTDIEEDDDLRNCDLCDVLLCGGCNRRCEGCGNTVCGSHRCSKECCDGAYCDECHWADYESFTAQDARFYGGSRMEERKSIWQTAGVVGLTMIVAGAAYIWSHKKE